MVDGDEIIASDGWVKHGLEEVFVLQRFHYHLPSLFPRREKLRLLVRGKVCDVDLMYLLLLMGRRIKASVDLGVPSGTRPLTDERRGNSWR